jgi:hypothetical protein
MAPEKERRKIQNLLSALDKKALDRSVKVEFYERNEITPVEIMKKYDQGVIKYFLVKPSETVKAGYIQSLWEKEIFKWVWGSRELGIEP